MSGDKKLNGLFICPNCRREINEKPNYFECANCQKEIEKMDYIDFVGEIQKTLKNERDLESFLKMPDFSKRQYGGAREIVADFSNRYIRDAYLKIIKDLKLDFNNRTILEVGGGLGELAEQIKEIFPRTNYIFSDYIKNNVIEAINSGRLKKVDLKITADIYNLPIKDESIDIIILSEILEHLDNLSLAMKEIRRVLKKRGLILASVPNSVMYFYPLPFLQQILNPKKLYRRLKREENDNDSGFYHRPFLPCQFRRLFTKEGYYILKHNSMGLYFFYFPLNRLIKKYPDNLLIKSLTKFLIKISDLIPAINLFLLKFIGMRQIIVIQKNN